jgi:TetR/AcrR family transcriptional regulator
MGVRRPSPKFEIEPTLRRPAPELGPRARRTIELVLEATKEVFLARGYGGTSIDDIARAAGVSRASFYTYFPSKRDALLAVGADASAAFEVVVDALRELSGDDRVAEIAAWIEHDYFPFLDSYGSFVLAWAEAAYADDALRAAGMKRHLASCRRLGETLEALRGRPLGSTTQQGLLVSSMVERAWSYRRLYMEAMNDAELAHDAAVIIAATLDGGAA